MRGNAKSIQQGPYIDTNIFSSKVKEEISKLLDIDFIYEVEHTDWVSPIVLVSEENGELRVYVNLININVAMIRDHYPLSIMKHVVKRVA